MATPIYAISSETTPYFSTGSRNNFDLLRAAATGPGFGVLMDAVTSGTEQRAYVNVAGFPPMNWYSERLAADVTISGSITFSVGAKVSAAGVNSTLRFRLYKVTKGGSEVETLIAQGDGSSALTTTQATITFSATPAAAVTVTTYERFVLRLWAIPAPGQTMGTGTVTAYYGGDAASNGEIKVSFTETVTFLANLTRFYMRDTVTIGISTYFDALTTAGAAIKTGVVNTSAGGTEIQWTRTAAGTVLHWITQRFKDGFTLKGGSMVPYDLSTYYYESNSLANTAMRWRLYRYRAGVLTQFLLASDGVEMSTNTFNGKVFSNSFGQLTQTDFLPDDRIVARAFLINAPSLTMAAGYTATLSYNVASAGTGFTYLQLLDTPVLKAESDPAEPSTIPGGLPMTGVGN